MKKPCIFWITPIFSGIADFLLKGVDIDKGMPGSYNVIKSLSEAGHDVCILVQAGADKIPLSVNQNITIYKCGAPNWIRGLKIGRMRFILDILFTVRQGYALAKKNKPDLVYGHDGYGAAVAYCLGKFLNVPNLTRMYGSTLYGKCDGKLGVKIWLKYWPRILPFLIPAQHMIITQDGTEAEKIATTLKVNKGRIHCWLNGVDKSIYQPNFDSKAFKKLMGLPPDSKILLSVGRLEGWKRVDRLIETVSPLLKCRDDTYLILVGDGRDREMLEKLCIDLQIKDKTIFTGRVPRSEVVPFFNSADIFLSFYDYSNLSNTLLEAMTCGRCVIVLDTGETWRVVKHGENGFLIPIEDLPTVPDLIDGLLSNPKKIREIGCRARRFIETEAPTWDERVAREIHLIQHVVEKSR